MIKIRNLFFGFAITAIAGAQTYPPQISSGGTLTPGSCSTHQFGNATTTSGITCAQPSFLDLANSLQVGQFPALTGGDVTSAGGTFNLTVASVGGSTAANIHAAEALANGATSAAAANKLVLRDSSGNAAFNQVTIGGSGGNASVMTDSGGVYTLTLANPTGMTANLVLSAVNSAPGITSVPLYSGNAPNVGFSGWTPLMQQKTLAPAALSAEADNYNPSGYATSTKIILSASTAQNLSGIVAPSVDQQSLVLENFGTAAITLLGSSTNSSAGNRFCFTGNLPLVVGAEVTLQYDLTDTCWAVEGASVFDAANAAATAQTNAEAAFTGDVGKGANTFATLVTGIQGVPIGHTPDLQAYFGGLASGTVNTTSSDTIRFPYAVSLTEIDITTASVSAGCTTNATLTVQSGSASGSLTATSLTVSTANSASVFYTGGASVSVAAGYFVNIRVTTATAGCTTAPGATYAVVHYQMQ